MIKFVDLSIVIKNTLIISDLHIGYEEALNKQGVMVPRLQFNKLKIRLTKLFKKVQPKTVIINGDLKHEFGTISKQEWRDTLKIIDLITLTSKLIIIKGNHDSIMGPIAKKRNVEFKSSHIIDNIIILHGDKIPKIIKQDTIIIGHEHPAITLREGAKKEIYKCFLKGKFRNKTLYVLPSFNFTSEGTDITYEKLLSPFLKEMKSVQVTISQDNELYNFGKVKLGNNV